MKNEIPGPKNKGSEDSRRKGHRNIGSGGGDDATAGTAPRADVPPAARPVPADERHPGSGVEQVGVAVVDEVTLLAVWLL